MLNSNGTAAQHKSRVRLTLGQIKSKGRGINEERKEKEYSHTAKQGKQDHFYIKTGDIRIFKCLM
jgi:hypothetical protein